MVPGSTLMYGSSLMLVTRMPRDSRIAARDAAAMPLPREETTPPVTKTYLVIYLACVGFEEFTPFPRLHRKAGRAFCARDARPCLRCYLIRFHVATALPPADAAGAFLCIPSPFSL